MQSAFRLVYAVALLLLSLSVVANASSSTGVVTYVGCFSNMRVTSEHAYGYSVELWRNGNELIGFLSSADGLAGDTPTGLLENVQFNKATGALFFTAKLSIARVYPGKDRQEPTHDLFTFKGTFQNEKTLSGVLTHVDKLLPSQFPTVEQLQLVKTGSDSAGEFTTYDEWKQFANRIMKFRGPKW